MVKVLTCYRIQTARGGGYMYGHAFSCIDKFDQENILKLQDSLLDTAKEESPELGACINILSIQKLDG